MKKKILSIFLAAMLLLGLSACKTQQKESSSQIYAMDTIMRLTAYGSKGEEAIEAASELIMRLEHLWSVTDEGSDIWAINEAAGQWVSVTPETIDLLTNALVLAEETQGALDPSIYPVVRAWGFTTGDYRVPTQQELTALLERVDHSAIEVDAEGKRVRIPDGTKIDVGAIAKGAAGRMAAQLMVDLGVKSALLDLGGNIQPVGVKPDGSAWRVGVQIPNYEGTAYLAAVESTGRAVVTSGGYQRYFEMGGVRYIHIIDPTTGYPAESGLDSVTVVGEDGGLCDALSTAIFVMGEERGVQLWRDRGDFDLLLIRADGSILVTEGLEQSVMLADGYGDTKIDIAR